MSLPDDLTAAYRARTLGLRARTYRDLLKLWPAFNPDDADAVAAWMAGANAVTLRDYQASAALAREYADLHAFASTVPDLNVAAPAVIEREAVDTSLRVTSLVAFRKARAAGKSRDKALEIAYVRSSGSAARHALDGGRSVLMRTATTDPRVAGWRRTGNPQCRWCRELIGRGQVYRTADSADFAAHDHCSCGAENVYTSEARDVRAFAQSSRFRTQEARDANNARIRAYLRAT